MDKAKQFKQWMSERMGHSWQLQLAKEAIIELEAQIEFKIKECQELAQACNRYKGSEKDSNQKFDKLANSANFMRYVIHEKGLHDWADEPRKRMEAILYDENDKLIID